MKTFAWQLSLLFCAASLLSTPVQAKKKHHSSPTPGPFATPASEPPALPAEAAPQINADAPPSASLQPFVDAHLAAALAPLGQPAFAQAELPASMKASYADGMVKAADSHKPPFQLAQNVCDALISAMNERQNAVAALRGALATRSSEAAQPRGGGEAVEEARDKDAFFVDSMKNNWLQRANVLRQSITALNLQERASERQIGAWSPPPVVVAATPAVSGPPAPAVPQSTPDPVIGSWTFHNNSGLTLAADHSISGGRHGTWKYTWTTNAGRNYEFSYPPPKNWTDYVVLSADGRTLDGHTRHDEFIEFVRQ